VSMNKISSIHLQRRIKQNVETHDNFHALYLDDSFKDFTMSYGEATFRAHKCVLAASSMYFQRMFSNEWKESTLCSMAPLFELESAVFSAFLQFIYTRNHTLLGRYPWQFWELCDYFEVLPSLKEQVISHLLNVLTVETACVAKWHVCLF
jgi:hypothetical protein